jgi:hypothetical protein
LNFTIRRVADGTFTVINGAVSVSGFPDHASAAAWVTDYLFRMIAAANRKESADRWAAAPVVLDPPPSPRPLCDP